MDFVGAATGEFVDIVNFGLRCFDRDAKRIAFGHITRLAQAWIDGRTEEAELHANLAYTYNPTPEKSAANNLGYFFMATGHADRAAGMFKSAVETSDKELSTKALATYNLAILEAKGGNYSTSVQLLRVCAQTLLEVPENERTAGCIQVPIRNAGGEIEFSEISGPDLGRACEDAVVAIQKSIPQ